MKPVVRWPGKSLRAPAESVPCDRCDGKGTIRDEERREVSTCMRCGGKGIVKGTG